MSALRSFRDGRLRRVRRIATVSVLVVAGLMWIGAAQAVHDNGMFELDGNVVHDSLTTPPYDWTDLFDAGGTPLITPDPINGPVLASAFVDDTDAVDTSYFGGGTKIDDQVHNMSCGGPAANDKTSMDYVYASLIQVPANAPDNAGHQVLYFGIEKQAAGNGGDNAFGFWLFQNKDVGCVASVSTNFTGAHTDGDLFVDGTFTNGGGTSNIEVFRWNGDDTGSLGTTPIKLGGVCGTVAGTDDACGIANSGPITSGPWRSSPTMAANTFVEAGIDMTDLLGSGGGCFSTFLADSQSSQSTNSQPKDYASGHFNTCVPPIIDTTATPGGSSDPLGVADEHDVATISPVGGRPDPTGSISFFLCKPSEVTAGGCESDAGTQVGGAVPIVNGKADVGQCQPVADDHDRHVLLARRVHAGRGRQQVLRRGKPHQQRQRVLHGDPGVSAGFDGCISGFGRCRFGCFGFGVGYGDVHGWLPVGRSGCVVHAVQRCQLLDRDQRDRLGDDRWWGGDVHG